MFISQLVQSLGVPELHPKSLGFPVELYSHPQIESCIPEVLPVHHFCTIVTLQGPGNCCWEEGAELPTQHGLWPLGAHLYPVPVQLGAGGLASSLTDTRLKPHCLGQAILFTFTVVQQGLLCR